MTSAARQRSSADDSFSITAFTLLSDCLNGQSVNLTGGLANFPVPRRQGDGRLRGCTAPVAGVRCG